MMTFNAVVRAGFVVTAAMRGLHVCPGNQRRSHKVQDVFVVLILVVMQRAAAL